MSNMLTISSGPRLMVDRTEFEKSLTELPGEGKTYSSKEEGTKVWRNKTHRKYYESVPKPMKDKSIGNTDRKAIEYKSPRSYRSDRSDRSVNIGSINRNHRAIAVTDDQKIVTADELDKIFLDFDPKGLERSDSYSYIPLVRDVAIQCNRKKTNRHLNTSSDSTDSYVRVIKSTNDGFVTAYSDVPHLKTGSISKRTPISKHEVWEERSPEIEALYSKVDKTKKKSFRRDTDSDYNYPQNEDFTENYPQVIYRTPLNERRAPSGLSHHSRYSGSEYSTNPNRVLKNKTKGIGFSMKSGIDGPNVDLPKMSPKLRSKSLTRYEEPTQKWTNSLPRNKYNKEVKEEVLEETISISNASSDDLQPYYNKNFDEYLKPKNEFREVESKRKEISYVNEIPNQRKLRNGDDEGMGIRPIDQDYRRSMPQNGLSFPAINEPSYSTLSRFDSRKKDSKPTEFTPVPRQAFTLDRRHLRERQKRLEAQSDLSGTERENLNPRLNKSTADLTERSSRNDDLRGGLANAYRNRQEKRTSSLNRMSAIREDRMSPSSPSTPIRYLSHTHLNSTGNSANSSSDSDTLNRHKRYYVHDREPIVMYIPAVSHHNKRAEDEPDRLSGILRPSSRTGSTASSSRKLSSKRPPKSSASSDITPSKPRNYTGYGTQRPTNDEELDQIVELKDTKSFGKLKGKGGKSILSRRHSIPKDTKFPWLHKLKSKVKFRDP